ncbi:MAG TPA: hypothetical protein VLN26_17780 [Gaiellaceae bacterium]|nr:hypothetical protein [Gaiellaceae bacterium]
MRERWWGSTGRRVPEISVDGELDLGGALVLDSVDDVEALKAAHAEGRPVAVRAGDLAALKRALARPEVATVVVPTQELRDVDLTELTYG